jgi:hypothetical protein
MPRIFGKPLSAKQSVGAAMSTNKRFQMRFKAAHKVGVIMKIEMLGTGCAKDKTLV